MERTIRLNFDVSLVYGPRTWRAPIVAAMLLCAVGDLNSESVTLSTYYPAPSGVYTNMITTGNTFLARDGQTVTVGAGASLSKLGVVGGVAVGTYATSNAAPANGLIVQGKVGVGTPTPGIPPVPTPLSSTMMLDVVGSIKISAAGCAVADVTQGVVCGGFPLKYATFTPGFYIEGWSYQNRGGAVIVEGAPGQTSTQVRGLNPLTGNEGWMTLKKDDSQTRIWCCPR